MYTIPTSSIPQFVLATFFVVGVLRQVLCVVQASLKLRIFQSQLADYRHAPWKPGVTNMYHDSLGLQACPMTVWDYRHVPWQFEIKDMYNGDLGLQACTMTTWNYRHVPWQPGITLMHLENLELQACVITTCWSPAPSFLFFYGTGYQTQVLVSSR